MKRADIGYLTDAEAHPRPDAPVLRLDVVATEMAGHAYSKVMKLDLFQPVMVSASKVRITPRPGRPRRSHHHERDVAEAILANIDWIVFEFIKAFRQGNGKSVPKVGEFFDFGPSPDEPTEAERRPKGLPWSASQNGLQMTAWPSPVRPVVFAAIRNISPRTIHYCDYLLGDMEFVGLSARRKGDAEWTRSRYARIPITRTSAGCVRSQRHAAARSGNAAQSRQAGGWSAQGEAEVHLHRGPDQL